VAKEYMDYTLVQEIISNPLKINNLENGKERNFLKSIMLTVNWQEKNMEFGFMNNISSVIVV